MPQPDLPRHEPSPAGAEHAIPLALRSLRAALGLTGAISPELAGRWAHWLWYRSRRYPEPPREQDWLRSARRSRLPHRGRPLAVYDWGTGPTVLLVHGWHGRGPQLGAFAVALAAAGMRAVAFDTPAHGRTPGRSTNLPEVSAALRAVAAAFGPVHGLIAHSFGAPCALHAMGEGLAVDRMAVLAAPSSVEFLIDSFAGTLALPLPVVRVLRRRLEERFGPDLWVRFAPRELVRARPVPALVLHDEDDREVPVEEGAALAAAWPGALFERTRGLGHRRMLRADAVVARVVEFLAAPLPAGRDRTTDDPEGPMP